MNRGAIFVFPLIIAMAMLWFVACSQGEISSPGDTISRASLNGPLAGAEISAYLLSDLSTPVETGTTSDGRNPKDAGIFNLRLNGIDDNEWIVVAVHGGTDIGDGDSDTANTGTIYGLARAGSWRHGGDVNALSDILWRYARDWNQEVSPQAFAKQVDQLASMLLARDLDGGGIHASDVVFFNVLANAFEDVNFDYARLFEADGYAAAVIANESEEIIRGLLAEIFGVEMNFSPPEQMPDETRLSLSVFGDGGIRLFSHDTGVALVDASQAGVLVDGQPLIESIEEDDPDQRNLFFVRSPKQIVLEAVPVGDGYPASEQTRVLAWSGCDSVSLDQMQCAVSLENSRDVEVEFDYVQTTLAPNVEFLDISERAVSRLSEWDTTTDPERAQLNIEVDRLDLELLTQMASFGSDPDIGYYLAGIDASPNGAPFLVKVLEVQGHIDNAWVFTVEQAALEDVIDQGSTVHDQVMFPEDLIADSTVVSAMMTLNDPTIPKPVTVPAYLEPSVDPRDPTFRIRLGSPAAVADGAAVQSLKRGSGSFTISGPNGTALRISGGLDMSIKVKTGIQFKKWSFGKIKRFKFVPTVNVKPNLSISGNIAGGFRREIGLLSLRFSRIKFMVGPVPVWISPIVDVRLGTNGRLSGTVSTSIQYAMTIKGGVKYKRKKGWRAVRGAEMSRSFQGPTLTGSASMSAYVSVDPSLYIYDLTGPGLKIRPGLNLYGKARADLSSPQCYDLRTSLTGGVMGYGSWVLKGKLAKLLRLKKSFDFRIFRWEKTLARRRYNPCTNSPSALKVSGTVDDIVMLQNSDHDQTFAYTVENANRAPGYSLNWSVQASPNDGHIVFGTRSGRLDAGGSTRVPVQLAGTSTLAPGRHTYRLVFRNVGSRNVDRPTEVEKYVRVHVIEPLANPEITTGMMVAPKEVQVDWTYTGNIDYLAGFNVLYALNADGCPNTSDPGAWQRLGWASRYQRSLRAVLPYGDYCLAIEAVGTLDPQMRSYSTVYSFANIMCDRDGDGYMSAYLPGCGGEDCCDDANGKSPGCTKERAALINPGVTEDGYNNCEDGIDNNCSGIDAYCGEY